MRLIALFVITCLSALAQQGQPVNISEGPPANKWTSLYKYDASSNLAYICYAHGAQANHAWTVSGATLTGITDATNTSTVTTSTDHGLQVGNVVTIANTLVANWAAAAITSIVDAANTATITFAAAHGLDTNDVITISGVTTDTDLNGTYLFTSTGAATGTITTASVTDATYDATSDPALAIAYGDTDLAGSYLIATVPTSATFTITTANVTDGVYNEASTLSVSTTAPRSNAAVWDVRRLQYDTSGNLTAAHWGIGSISAKAFAGGTQQSCDGAASLAYR